MFPQLTSVLVPSQSESNHVRLAGNATKNSFDLSFRSFQLVVTVLRVQHLWNSRLALRMLFVYVLNVIRVMKYASTAARICKERQRCNTQRSSALSSFNEDGLTLFRLISSLFPLGGSVQAYKILAVQNAYCSSDLPPSGGTIHSRFAMQDASSSLNQRRSLPTAKLCLLGACLHSPLFPATLACLFIFSISCSVRSAAGCYLCPCQ